jgi:hypothetical protein
MQPLVVCGVAAERFQARRDTTACGHFAMFRSTFGRGWECGAMTQLLFAFTQPLDESHYMNSGSQAHGASLIIGIVLIVALPLAILAWRLVTLTKNRSR